MRCFVYSSRLGILPVFTLSMLFLAVAQSAHSAQAVPLDCAATAATGVPQAECETLVALYTDTNGPDWIDSTNWNTATYVGEWYGVMVSGEHVAALVLDINGLEGSLPDLSALTQLQSLDLSGNQLSGSIPDLSALTQLQQLALITNQLSGKIPDLSALIQLQSILLGNNQLSGEIPNLSALTQLVLLALDRNQLTGSVPDLSTLTQLQSLDLSGNQLSGSIPDLSALTQLEGLFLGNNQLVSEIPPSITRTAIAADHLSLCGGGNVITSSDPDVIAWVQARDARWTPGCGQLTSTDCTDTATTGIPQAECEALVALYSSTSGPGWADHTGWNTATPVSEWYRVTVKEGHVTGLGMDNNQLKGSLPDLSALTELRTLVLSGNQLSGSIPDLSAFTELQTLFLGNNQLSGEIPDLSAPVQLRSLHLNDNQLSGSIPDLSALTQLTSLYLDYNQLAGEIPDLSALTQLERLVLMGNQLSGEIPDLSALTQLRTLFLGDNQLVSEIPPSITGTAIVDGNLDLCGGGNVIISSDPDVIAFVQARDENWTPGCVK